MYYTNTLFHISLLHDSNLLILLFVLNINKFVLFNMFLPL